MPVCDPIASYYAFVVSNLTVHEAKIKHGRSVYKVHVTRLTISLLKSFFFLYRIIFLFFFKLMHFVAYNKKKMIFLLHLSLHIEIDHEVRVQIVCIALKI